MDNAVSKRRGFLKLLAGAVGGFALSKTAQAEQMTDDFGPPVKHKVVYQCNKADAEYLNHVLFSCAEMVRKYGEEIALVVDCFGPGVQILGKHPTRFISQNIRDRVESLSYYGVSFHACGNTMKSLNWEKEDMVDFAKIVQIGVDDLMKLQEQGYSYVSW